MAVLAVACQAVSAQMAMTSPPVPRAGDRARDFTLPSLEGARVRLANERASQPVVVVVLRGWPGYQCPFCTRQFSDYLTHAKAFEGVARVLFVYPGPKDGLEPHATAFTASRPMPAAVRVLLDPDYSFTQAYGLRWDAPQETAYPATFVVDTDGVIRFARISREHGGRVAATEVLGALAALRR